MKPKTSQKKGRSVFISWLVSYMSILLIPMLISGFVYIEASKIIERDTNRANWALIRQTKQAIDSDLADIEKLSLQIALNSKVDSLLYAKPPHSARHHYIRASFIEDLSSYIATNSIVDKFYVYFSNSDIIITPTSVYSPRLLFDSIYKEQGAIYEDWYNLIRLSHRRELQPIIMGKESKRLAEHFAYMQSLPLSSMGNNLATVVISIDDGRFKDAIQNIQWMESSTVVVLDDRNNIMGLSGNTDTALSLAYEILEDKSGTVRNNIDGQPVIVQYISSDITNWKYVSITPIKVFMERVEYIRYLTIISLVASMLIGGIVAYIFSRKNYNPLEQVVDSLAIGLGMELDGGYNEYKFIKDAVFVALSENEKIKKRLEQQNRVIRDNFLTKLLKGSHLDILSFEDMDLKFDMKFHSNNFLVSLIYIEDFRKLFEDQNNMKATDQISLVHFIIGNVMKETLEERYDFYLIEIDNLLGAIINLKYEPEDETIEDIKEKIESARKFIEEHFHIILTITLSDIAYATASISSAYRQALDTMEHRMILGTGHITTYNDIKVSRPYYNYSLDEEQRLINFIKSGDYSNSKEILLRVVNDNSSDSNITVDILKCLLSDLICTIMKAVDEEDNLDVLMQGSAIESILGSSDIVEMKYQMLRLLNNICEHNKAKALEAEFKFREKIEEYVEENYYDKDLNVSTIGAYFDMTPSYISRLFKEGTGESLLDYINTIRLKKAKELLLQEELTVERVGTMVGYSNINTFIRVFKRYEGITPGKYRELA
ncbi:MAG: AraC family transcriptional regulator [Clostridiales bacterium]|nr:AraC family transcriptional regulator [Clostridiales bacterium]